MGYRPKCVSEIGSEVLCRKGLELFECGCLKRYENFLVPRVRQDDEEERVHVVRQDALAVQGSRLR